MLNSNNTQPEYGLDGFLKFANIPKNIAKNNSDGK